MSENFSFVRGCLRLICSIHTERCVYTHETGIQKISPTNGLRITLVSCLWEYGIYSET